MRTCKFCNIPLPNNIRGLACHICRNGMDRYGMDKNAQLKLLEIQDGRCALCKKPLSMFQGHKGGYIDHDHRTGKVRGILCHPCNVVLGYIENANIEEQFQKYLIPL